MFCSRVSTKSLLLVYVMKAASFAMDLVPSVARPGRWPVGPVADRPRDRGRGEGQPGMSPAVRAQRYFAPSTATGFSVV